MDEKYSISPASGNVPLTIEDRPPATPEDVAFDALISGLARLIEGQRHFAAEFGLHDERVFFDGFECFKGRDIDTVLRTWLFDQMHGAERFAALFDDLYTHQLALIAAMDGVALHAIRASRRASWWTRHGGIWWKWLRSLVMGRAHSAFDALEHDQGHRYREVVMPGLAAGYTQPRGAAVCRVMDQSEAERK